MQCHEHKWLGVKLAQDYAFPVKTGLEQHHSIAVAAAALYLLMKWFVQSVVAKMKHREYVELLDSSIEEACGKMTLFPL